MTNRLRLTALLAVAACGGVPRPMLNDPTTAKSFFCSISEESTQKNFCVVTKDACEAEVTRQAQSGAFMAPCHESASAYCFVGSELHGDSNVAVCTPRRDDCQIRQSSAQGLVRVGECVERRAGA